jgi:two-component system response regulator AtoC
VTSGITQRVLLIGPDDDLRRALVTALDRRGLTVAAAGDLDAARRHLAADRCDVVLATPELAEPSCREPAAPPVIAVIRTRELAAAQPLLAAGVADILTEPIDELAILLALRRVAAAPRRVAAAPIQALVGDGAAMQKLKGLIRTVGATRTTVLVLGESGTGKELVARALHEASPRRERRFVALNCAAVPATLIESELFGHVRGAFTDAVRDKPGLFEEADGGTLFLDEIGELTPPLQAKLLRALQESEIRRVGDTTPIKVDVRLIAATLRDLAVDVAEGRFREDLYYRLNVVPIHVPPLRERAEDIPQLSRFFAARHAARHGREVALSDPAIDALARQPWPGNVRELENVIERALVLADGPAVDAEFLGTVMRVKPGPAPADDSELSIKKATRSLEQELIRRALGVTQGNRTNAAKLLEISHRALLYKMKEYGIS